MIGLKDMEKFNRKLVYKKVSPKDLFMFVEDLQKVLTMYGEIKKDNVLYNHLFVKFSHIDIETICNNIIHFMITIKTIKKIKK
jgi:hypothetical protein